MARLKEYYQKEVVPAMVKEFSYKNIMAVPKLSKIIVNMGVGEAKADFKILEKAMKELSLITGQKPKMTRAKKSIASFNLRENSPIGCFTTLRRERMYEFLDRLVSIVLPRVRDFQGVPARSFDGRGNYTMGVKDQLVFPEIDYSQVDKIKGMNITIVTTAKTDEEAMRLLQLFGVPFRRKR